MDDDKKDTGAEDINSGEDRVDLESPIEKETPPSTEEEETIPGLSPLPEAEKTMPAPPAGQKENWFKRFIRTKKGKVITVIVSLLVVAGVLFAIPFTRYTILGLFLKKEVKLLVTDSKTKKPVTHATVEVGKLSARTDTNGKVDLKDVPVGEYPVKVSKKNYKDTNSSYVVPIFTASEQTTINLEATGRQVIVTLTNVITKKPIQDAIITADEVTAVTDEKGEASLVLPADKQTVKGTIKHDDYNEDEVELTVSDQQDANNLTLTPSGTVYYLSKATGKINVMKANLDGSEAAVVVEATGNELDSATALLAARDWQYMVLSAKRKADVAGQIYVVDAKTNSLKSVDEGNVEIKLVGWSDHNFLYIVTRNDKEWWQEKRQALKSYNAETGKLTVLDETAATGSSYTDGEYESFGDPYIIEGKLVYIKNVSRGVGAPKTKKPAIMTATISNAQVQRVKEFAFTQYASLAAKLYKPQEVYFRAQMDNGAIEFYEYEASGLKSVTNNDSKFHNTYYPTFLVSPGGQKTLWDEPRNGKNALFIGDKNGSNSTEIAQQSEYETYGWHSDKYILLNKNASELYVAPADQPLDTPLKITNYHKPVTNFEGYGYGYGGL